MNIVLQYSHAALWIIFFAGASPVTAQDDRIYGSAPDTSLIFDRQFEPLARVKTPKACEDLCWKNAHCNAWTFYHLDFAGTESQDIQELLRGVCVTGTGVKHRNLRNAPGRTSGEPRGCPPSSLGHDQYVC